MTRSVPASRRGDERRRLVVAGTLAFALAVFVPGPWSAGMAASDRPVSFMRQVANQLMAASRSGSPHAMVEVIRRYGDVPDIGLYSLGSYMKHLPRDRRASYYDGVTRFIARYLLAQSRSYPIARVEIFGPSSRAQWGHTVNSRITLKDGSTYRVQWLVVPRRGGFKVRDASLLGFWLTPFQRRLFEGYIDKNGGKVQALLSALGG